MDITPEIRAAINKYLEKHSMSELARAVKNESHSRQRVEVRHCNVH
jgi:hypothetical protein